MKIGVIVGHGRSKAGGYDPGACAFGYEEFKICKDIALSCYNYLAKNFNCAPKLVNYDGSMKLQEKINLFSTGACKDYDLLLEIHMNAAKGTGTEVYYYTGDSKGRKYAQEISKTVSGTLGIRDRGAKPSTYYGIIRETKPRALLVETAFIDSNDVRTVNTAAGQKKAGEAIADAIAKVADLKPKTDPVTGLYRVQVGAFADKKNAEAMEKELKSKGYSTIIKKQ